MPLIRLLHGFTQTRASFASLRCALAGHDIDSEALPLPGHEVGSGADRVVTGDLWAGARDLKHDHQAGIWLGYSMGARLALHLTLAHPHTVTALILLSGTAGIDDDAERAKRRADDEALAIRLERIGVDTFLDEWLANPLFSGLPMDPERKRRRATNSTAGLASSLRRWGTGTMDPPLWDRLGTIAVPTLVLAGSRDTKFTLLGRRCATMIGPNARFESIPNSGHAAHIEAPEPTAQVIADWLESVDAP